LFEIVTVYIEAFNIFYLFMVVIISKKRMEVSQWLARWQSIRMIPVPF
jgi:hypothetical protein